MKRELVSKHFLPVKKIMINTRCYLIFALYFLDSCTLLDSRVTVTFHYSYTFLTCKLFQTVQQLSPSLIPVLFKYVHIFRLFVIRYLILALYFLNPRIFSDNWVSVSFFILVLFKLTTILYLKGFCKQLIELLRYKCQEVHTMYIFIIWQHGVIPVPFKVILQPP